MSDPAENQVWPRSTRACLSFKKILNINLPDPPTVTVQKVSLTQESSLFLELVCSADSNPPSQPKWVRISEGGRIGNISENGGSVWVDQRGKDGVISVVVIQNPQVHHLGTYICTATNAVGEGHQMIMLKGKLSNNPSEKNHKLKMEFSK